MIGILIGAAVLAGAILGSAGVAIVAVAGLAAIQLGWTRPVQVGLLLTAAVIGLTRVNGHERTESAPNWASTAHAFYASVSNNATDNGSVQRFVAVVRPASRAETESAVACVTAPALPRVGRGDEIYFVTDVKTTSQATSSFAAYMQRTGCTVAMTTYRAYVLSTGSGLLAQLDRFRERLSEGVRRALPGDAGAFVSGLATGDDAALSDRAREAFFETGTSHVTAVSGSNLALFIAAFSIAGSAAGWMRKFAWQLATATIVWLYVAMIGLGAPAVRAALVASLALVAVRLGRKPDLLTLGVLVAAGQVLYDPSELGLLSFRLSTAATLGLLLALSGPYPTTIRGWVWKAMATSIAANLATAPFLLASVGLPFPLVAIAANVVIVPIVDVLSPLSVVISLIAYCSPSVAAVVSPPVELLSRGALWLVQLFARLPGAKLQAGSLPIGAWTLAAIVVLCFCMASAECRGGLARLVRRGRERQPVEVGFAAAVVGAALLGSAAAWFAR